MQQASKKRKLCTDDMSRKNAVQFEPFWSMMIFASLQSQIVWCPSLSSITTTHYKNIEHSHVRHATPGMVLGIVWQDLGMDAIPDWATWRQPVCYSAVDVHLRKRGNCKYHLAEMWCRIFANMMVVAQRTIRTTDFKKDIRASTQDLVKIHAWIFPIA